MNNMIIKNKQNKQKKLKEIKKIFKFYKKVTYVIPKDNICYSKR